MSGASVDSPETGRAHRRRWLVAAVLAVAALGGVAALALTARTPADDAPLPVKGRPTLELDLPTLDGAGRVRSQDLRGTPLVVNFWASWCGPCRREMPALVSAAKRFDGDVRFVGVNNEDNREDATEFAASAGATYPSGFDPQGEVARRIGLRGMPTTLFVDANGRILEQRTGELTDATLAKTIDRLFGVGPARS